MAQCGATNPSLPKSTKSHLMKVLREAGLIRNEPHGRQRLVSLRRDEVDATTVENERRVAEATAKEEGKPEAALSRIVEGRVNGFFKENVLLEQPFAKDAKKTVAKVLEEAGTTATSFARFRVGS